MLHNAVFMTGASRRIGLYLARQFLEQADYPVVFTYRTSRPEVDELKKLGAIGIQLDLTEPQALDRLLTFLEKEVASLRAVIHNASRWASDAEVGRHPALYQAMFDLHVHLPYRLNLELQPLLLQSQSEKRDIISLSDSSVTIADGSHIAYMASKSALQNLSRNFAKRFAPQVKVNDIAPGLILFHPEDDERYRQRRLAQSAIGIEPGEEVIWEAVQYLMNSPYTTGVSLPVDGGRRLV